MKIFLLLMVSVTLPAAPLRCGIPLDVVTLTQDNRESLLSLFEKGDGSVDDSAIEKAPLEVFWRTLNRSALRRASASLMIVQEAALKQIVPGTKFELRLERDTPSAVADVAAGKLDTAWVRGDLPHADLAEVVEAHTAIHSADEEEYVFVARKAADVSLDRVQKDGLKVGYPSLSLDVLQPLKAMHLDPFPERGSLGPYLYVRTYYYGEDGIEALMRGDVDLAAVEPGDWKYYIALYPARSKRVVPTTTTPNYVILSRLDAPPRHPRLGVYLTKGEATFIASVGQDAFDKRVLPPIVKSLESVEEVLDATAASLGLDIALVPRRGLNSYGSLKPGVSRGLKVIGTLPKVAPPLLVSGEGVDVDSLRATFRRFDWHSSKFTFITNYLLMRGFTYFAVPANGGVR